MNNYHENRALKVKRDCIMFSDFRGFMDIRTLFDLVCKVLPHNISPAELMAIGDSKCWKEHPDAALEYALRHYPKIDWQAYLENYPDVHAAGMDPVSHFLKDGVFENRSIFSHSKLVYSNPDAAPLLSIVLVADNNWRLIEKSFKSVSNQIFNDFELLIAGYEFPDGLVNELRGNTNIKILTDIRYLDWHEKRKIALNLAKGAYVFFIDAGDEFDPIAFEQLVHTALKGFDITGYEESCKELQDRESENIKLIADRAQHKYFKRDILRKAFIEKTISPTLRGKIVERHIAQEAFSVLSERCPDDVSDIYEFLAIANIADTFISLPGNLAGYNAGPPISSSNMHMKYRGGDLQGGIRILEDFCQPRRLDSELYHIKTSIIKNYVNYMAFLDESGRLDLIDSLIEVFGVRPLVNVILDLHFSNWRIMTEKFGAYMRKGAPTKPKRIAMLYSRLEGGGIETTIRNICNLLDPRGYEVILILYERIRTPELINPDIKIVYIPPPANNLEGMKKHINALQSVLEEFKPRCLFDWWIHGPEALVHLILCHLLGIEVIGSLRFDHNFELLMRGRSYTHKEMLNTLRCMEKLFCLTISAEIYLRSWGIDAFYLPNTIRYLPNAQPTCCASADIAFLCRLHDPKKGVADALLVLAEVLKERPDARLRIIGEFEQFDKEKAFIAKIKKLGLENSVEMVGWQTDPADILSKCKVFLSTSFMEGFPNSIAEAQVCGLPVVMYELDITMAIDNESIIMTPQKIFKEAAREIVALLNDEERRLCLSSVAVACAKRFSQERFVTEICDLIDNFSYKSRFSQYKPSDYQRAINTMAFYAGKKMPD